MIAQAPNEDEALKEVVEVSFSGDEVGGRYLDVHEHFHHFVNAKFGKQLDYLEYLTSFSDVSGISRQHRLGKPYRQATCIILAFLLRNTASEHQHLRVCHWWRVCPS